jgi:hypothetical protein
MSNRAPGTPAPESDGIAQSRRDRALAPVNSVTF